MNTAQNSTDWFGVYFGTTGLTLTITLRKQSGVFGSAAPTVVDEGNGWYTIKPLAGHRDTLGVNNWLFVSGSESRPYAETVIEALTPTTIANEVWTDVDPETLATAQDVQSKASQASVDALQASIDGLAIGVGSRARIATSAVYEHPESGSVGYPITILVVDENGLPSAPDSLPTLAITNGTGADRSANLSAVALVSVGRYAATYTVDNGDTLEPLVLTTTVTIDGDDFVAVSLPVVTDAVAVDFTAADRSILSGLASGQHVTDEADRVIARGDAAWTAGSGGGGGGSGVVDSFSDDALAQLSAIEITLASPYSSKTKELRLVQRSDYTSTSLTGPVKIKLTNTGASAGDVGRFAAAFEGVRVQQSGTVVDESGTLYASIELTRTQTSLPASDQWKWELEHVSGTGEVSALLSDQRMTVLASHAEDS